MNDEQKSFLDGKTLAAVLLMIGVWVGWQSYLSKKYPAANKPATTVTSTQDAPPPQNPAAVQNSATITNGSEKTAIVENKDQKIAYDSPELSFEVSSRGMGLKNVVLKKYLDRTNNPLEIGADEQIIVFQTSLKGQTEPLFFNIAQSGPNEFIGTANSNGVTITKKLTVHSEGYYIDAVTDVNGAVSGITHYMSEDSRAEGSAGSHIFSGPEDALHVVGGEGKRELFKANEAAQHSIPKSTIAALGSRYFATAIADNSQVVPDLNAVADPSKKIVYAGLEYPWIAGATNLHIENKFFAGPKSLEILRAADPRLAKIVDFGFFSWIAYPIWDLLKILNGVFHNYGFAIIVLTLLVRLLVLPFNVMSYRSMKAMQVIQPQIARLKETYKNDREGLNREMMNLMKENKVNPIGGCLPMLLQLPVFIALYAVLMETIELYRSPFIFWIHDLSLKDPFYVLPVLMGITMFIQQKITPTTMDPAQAKVMLFMPVIFTFLMISLPSGLTLYIFVSTLFGIIQQLVFMRDKKVSVQPVGVKA